MLRMILIPAAGGVVWREGPGGLRVAVIHRPKRGDWSLPKGKLYDGEGWEAAAVREVKEETGCVCRLAEFASSHWSVPGGTPKPKVVLFWNMELHREGDLGDDDEVDEVAWLKPPAALARLDRESERRVLVRALARREARARPSDRDALRGDVARARARLLRRGLAERIGGEALGAGLARLDRAEDDLLKARGARAHAHLKAALRIVEAARAS
jgi:8-oxo-dGTP pyrophosphatase MutT (NUDIX family)